MSRKVQIWSPFLDLPKKLDALEWCNDMYLYIYTEQACEYEEFSLLSLVFLVHQTVQKQWSPVITAI